MKVYIVRHADAGKPKASAEADRNRELTAEGRKESAAVGRGLRAVKCRPDLIFTSPFARAGQTAEIISSALKGPRPEICGALASGGDQEDVLDCIRDAKAESVMIVGHMPDLGELACLLIAGDADFDIVFKKAGACCISFEGAPQAGKGSLEWLMQPKHLRAIARGGKG